MRVSYRWLKEYVDVNVPLKELVDALTMVGLEVEWFFDLGMFDGSFKVGEVKKIAPHPQSEKLLICDVSVGESKLLKVVCGAKNFKEGDRCPVAMIGAELPNHRRIEKAIINGIESEGMLCSGAELGLSEDASGILILPDDYEVGSGIDCIIEIAVAPNRPDCMSMVGIAREVAAIYNLKVKMPPSRIQEELEPADLSAKVVIQDKENCPRYAGRVIGDVVIKESPLWMQRRLEAVGLRAINNVVDVTNYILLELGHPIHTFDFELVEGETIYIREANNNEKILTIDGTELQLCNDDLVIADSKGAIALAGIMGGKETEVNENTKNVFLECAYFNPTSIRRTSSRHNIQSESSMRFERGTNRSGLPYVINRAAQLIREVSGGRIRKGIIDVNVSTITVQHIPLEIKKVNDLIGVELNASEIADILTRLGFEIMKSEKDKLYVVIPSHRVDIFADVDLIEEVARLYGYNLIPSDPPYITEKDLVLDETYKILDKLRDFVVSLGFQEVVNYSFVSREENDLFSKSGGTIELLNPVSKEYSCMRKSLIPSLLKNVAYNHHRNNLDLRLFEVARIYKSISDEGESTEDVVLCLVLSGKSPMDWSNKQTDYDFYDMKGICKVLLDNLGIKDVKYQESNSVIFNFGQSADVVHNNKKICSFGEIDYGIQEKYDLHSNIWILEMNLSEIKEYINFRKEFKEIPKFPAIKRDFAFLISKDTKSEAIEEIIRKMGGELVESIELFDMYEGKKIKKMQRSLAYSVLYRSREKTLTDDEINKIMEVTIETIKKECNATLR